jgi:ribonuclease VapC
MSGLVLDTSAILAILQREPDAGKLVRTLEQYDTRRIASATLLETCMVLFSRYGDAGEREADIFVHRTGTQVIPVTLEHVDVARAAYRRFGKGRHPAALNYGDCFSYALAKSLGEPLLFVGTDFARTDVEQPTAGLTSNRPGDGFRGQ